MLRRSSKKESDKKESDGPTRRISRDRVHQVFSPNVSPAITVSRGETIVVETQDCYRGLLTEEPETHRNVEQSGGIPVTGPIYVEEAHIGDVLSIQVKQIKPAGTGVFAVRPETGIPGQEIQQKVRILEVTDKQVQLDDRLNLPVHPVIGIMGVAAKHGEIDTVYPGRHGGNMDTLEITTGSRIFLPVQVNGGLLSLGDVKACVGDGQIAGSGVEVEAEVTLRVDTLPGGRFSWPRVESKGEWITITSASTVDQAARLAISEMVKWISQDKALDYDTAYALVSLGGGLHVSQWGNPLITARMVFPKRLISKIKSQPTASGRLNYRSLPPAANGDTGGETVAAEAEQPASRSSRGSGSSRSQRSSGRSRQTGGRRGTRQRSNGAPSPARDEATLEEAAKENGDVKDSRVTANGKGQDKTGRNGKDKEKAAQQARLPEQAESSPVQPETAPAVREEPDAMTKTPSDGPASATDARKEDSNTKDGSEPAAEVRKPSFGRRQRTVRRA